MNLKQKLGPLPRWAWLVIAAIVGFLAYRWIRGRSSGSNVQDTQSFITTSPSGVGNDLGVVPQAGSPSDSGSSTDSQLGSYGASLADMNSSLLDAIGQQSQNVVALASQQIAAAQSSTNLGSFQSETQPLAAAQPGTGNAPIVYYVSPNLQSGASAPATSQTAVKSTAVTTPTRYYTYEAQAKKAANGGTVKFRSGKGYYVA